MGIPAIPLVQRLAGLFFGAVVGVFGGFVSALSMVMLYSLPRLGPCPSSQDIDDSDRLFVGSLALVCAVVSGWLGAKRYWRNWRWDHDG